VKSSANHRRDKQDRRKTPTPIFSRHTLFGRRRSNRRRTDRQYNYYVDLYSARLFFILLLITILSLLDAGYTYRYIALGGKELNPIMDYFLNLGGNSFFTYKFLMTAIGVFVLCLHKNYRFARSMIAFVLLCYIVLMFYHVSILYAL
jgi:hypothetical protein